MKKKRCAIPRFDVRIFFQRCLKRYGSIGLLVLAFFLSSCSEDYFPEPEDRGGWRKNFDPVFIKSLGLDPKGVDEFGAYNLRVEGTSSAIVIKNGWVIGEWYADDRKEFQNIYLASIGKSFAIACFGIAVQDSKDGVVSHAIDRSAHVYDQRWLAEGFPLSDPRKDAVTFEQVFRHTAGFTPEGLKNEAGRDLWSDYVSWVVGHDPEWPQTQHLFYPPGQPEQYPEHECWGAHKGAYSSVGFAHIGLVLRELYGKPARVLLWERLLKPIGFSGIDYYHPPSSPEIKWFTGGGLMMRPMDLARFAYLLKNDGVWKKERILPQGWVSSFVDTPYYQNLRSNIDGYFGTRYPADMYRMYGSGGNFVFVIPSLDMIVIRTGRMRNFFLERLQHDFLRRAFNMIPGYRTM